jgi:hypothetical protein
LGDGHPSGKKTLDLFIRRSQWRLLKLKDYGRDQIVQTLMCLGLRYPRGPKIKNEGTHKKRYFDPHALWEGDGKQVNVIFKGHRYESCWFAFIDQNTTLITGSALEKEECSSSFAQAINRGKEKTGFYPMAVLLDNRLTQEEKSRVRQFCDDHDIIVINTFPGNSKSNGIVEGNFSIFEKQVGDIHITGETDAEIARSIMQNIVEIFTQQRNHRPRKRLQDLTPEEVAIGATRPLHQKSQLERLRDRLQEKENRTEQKGVLIEDLFASFEFMDEASLKKFRKELEKYTEEEIIAAHAAYRVAQAKHPERNYRSEYFLAILRNKREERLKQVYNEDHRAKYKAQLAIETEHLKSLNLKSTALKLVAFLAAAKNQAPSHTLMSVETACWALVDFAGPGLLPELWREIMSAAQRCRELSQRTWAVINEFIHQKIGRLLYESPGWVQNADAAESMTTLAH